MRTQKSIQAGGTLDSRSLIKKHYETRRKQTPGSENKTNKTRAIDGAKLEQEQEKLTNQVKTEKESHTGGKMKDSRDLGPELTWGEKVGDEGRKTGERDEETRQVRQRSGWETTTKLIIAVRENRRKKTRREWARRGAEALQKHTYTQTISDVTQLSNASVPHEAAHTEPCQHNHFRKLQLLHHKWRTGGDNGWRATGDSADDAGGHRR